MDKGRLKNFDQQQDTAGDNSNAMLIELLKTMSPVIEVGGEGGSITLLGLNKPTGWIFCRAIVDQSLLMLEDGPSFNHVSNVVHTWNEAIELLDRYPWYQLYPLYVDPNFKTETLIAVKERIFKHGSAYSRIDKWEEICT